MNYKDLGAEVGQLVDEKNTAYGNSFNVAEDFIKLLWPNGVPPEAFNDMLCVVRIFDKLKRIATNKGYGGESPYRDIAGYALLGLMKDQRKPLNAYSDEELNALYAEPETTEQNNEGYLDIAKLDPEYIMVGGNKIRNWCGQCGQQYTVLPACGITHSEMFYAWYPHKPDTKSEKKKSKRK